MTTLPGPERVKELREKLVLWSDLRDPSDLVIGRVYADLLALLDALPALRADNIRLQAELAAARPLLEAVKKNVCVQDGVAITTHAQADEILEAAQELALRRSAERAPAGHEEEKGEGG